MSRLTEIINEEISAIRKDKEKEIFDYRGIADDAWRKIIIAGQEFQKINFDLENDDTTGEKKTFYAKKNLRKDQPVKYEINAELYEAGGDWEMPVLYFRVELTHDYNIVQSDDWKKSHKPEYMWDLKRDYSGLYHCYILIPPVEAGNKLTKNYEGSSTGTPKEYDWFAYQNDGLTKEEEKEARITPADKLNAWKWLQDLLEKVVNERHKMLDS